MWLKRDQTLISGILLQQLRLLFTWLGFWHLKMKVPDNTTKTIQLSFYMCLLPCHVKNPGQTFIIFKWPYSKYRPWGMLTLRGPGGGALKREAVICRAVKTKIWEAVQFYSRESIWTEANQGGFKWALTEMQKGRSSHLQALVCDWAPAQVGNSK